MTDKFKATRDLYDRLGKKYLRLISKAQIPELFDFAKLFVKGSKILDVGSAGGRDVKKFTKLGMKVTGIDTSAVFIKEAKKFVPQARFLKKDIRKAGFKASEFDGIWASAVLLHLEKQEVLIVLRKFHRILKKNGVLHVSVKKGKGKKFIKGRIADSQQRLFSLFQRTELENMISEAGFKVILSKQSDDPLGRGSTKWITVWGKKV